MPNIVDQYLDLLDSQREAVFIALEGLNERQIWLRPGQGEWCPGEILDHNYLLFASTLPYVKAGWKVQQWRAEKMRDTPFLTEIEDPYRKSSFPMWVGFLWRPRFSPHHPLSREILKSESRSLHAEVRAFYEHKDPALLGHTFIFDPYFGRLNLILTLRIGIYHDQLHYEDLMKIASRSRN